MLMLQILLLGDQDQNLSPTGLYVLYKFPGNSCTEFCFQQKAMGTEV